MEFLSLSRRRSSARNVPGGEERVETNVFEGYPVSRKKIKTTGLHNFALFVFPLTCNHNSAFERQRGIIKFSILFLLNRVGVYCTHFLWIDQRNLSTPPPPHFALLFTKTNAKWPKWKQNCPKYFYFFKRFWRELVGCIKYDNSILWPSLEISCEML